MKRRAFFIYVVLGALAVLASAMSYGDASPLTGGFIIGLLAILFGIIAFVNPSKSGYSIGEGKSRSIAQDLSPIPGVGHLYLGRCKEGAVLLSSLVVSVVAVLASGFPGDVAGPILFAMGFGLAILSSAISLVSVCRACDEADLDFEVGFLSNFHVWGQRAWLNVLTIVAIAWAVAMAVCCVLSGAGATSMVACAGALASACAMRSAFV